MMAAPATTTSVMVPSTSAEATRNEWCAGSHWGGNRYLIGQNASMTAPRTKWTPGLLAGAGFVIAAGATVWGSLEKIQTFRDEVPGASLYKITVTWWEIDIAGDGFGRPTPYPPFGVLLAVAAGLFMIAAVLAFGAVTNARSGLITGARVSSALGVGLLAGAVALRLMDALQGVSQTNQREVGPGQVVEFVIGLGIWVPAAAVVVGLLGLIVLLGTTRETDVPHAAPDR